MQTKILFLLILLVAFSAAVNTSTYIYGNMFFLCNGALCTAPIIPPSGGGGGTPITTVGSTFLITPRALQVDNTTEPLPLDIHLDSCVLALCLKDTFCNDYVINNQVTRRLDVKVSNLSSEALGFEAYIKDVNASVLSVDSMSNYSFRLCVLINDEIQENRVKIVSFEDADSNYKETIKINIFAPSRAANIYTVENFFIVLIVLIIIFAYIKLPSKRSPIPFVENKQ